VKPGSLKREAFAAVMVLAWCYCIVGLLNID
jgi:hypothetical protein